MMNFQEELDKKSKVIEFLQSPEGQRYRAQYMIQEAERMLTSITQELKTNPDLNEGQCMVMNLAIHELVNEIQKQEKILNQL